MLKDTLLAKLAELEESMRYVPEPVKELLLLIAGAHDDANTAQPIAPPPTGPDLPPADETPPPADEPPQAA